MGQQDFARRGFGQRLHLRRGEHAAIHDTGFDRHRFVVAGIVQQDLGNSDRVAFGKTDGCRAGQKLAHLVYRHGVAGGELEQRVLDNAVLGVHVAQLLAKLSQLGHGQATIIRQDRGFGLPDQFFQVSDDFHFGAGGFNCIFCCDDIHLLLVCLVSKSA